MEPNLSYNERMMEDGHGTTWDADDHADNIWLRLDEEKASDDFCDGLDILPKIVRLFAIEKHNGRSDMTAAQARFFNAVNALIETEVQKEAERKARKS